MDNLDISSWIDITSNIGGDSVNFVIELGFEPKIVDISSNIYKLYGYKKDDLLSQKPCINKIIYQKDIKELYLNIHYSLLSKKREHSFSFRILTANNSIKSIKCFVKFYRDKRDKKILLFGYLTDITKMVSFEKKINYLTNYDRLTGLANRQKIKSIIDDEIKKSLDDNHASAVLYLDLNRFKNVNDTLGHLIGDRLLQHVSHRLKSCIKSEDTLARVGDDEFVILLSSINKKTLYSHIEIIAKRVYNILERPFSINDNLLHITTSIGVAILGVDGKNSSEILKHADTAMYLAKKDQDEYIKYYQSTMQEDNRTNLEMENDLRVALKENQFQLYYQPQIDVKSESIVGAEALIRWKHPQKGLVSPFKFISIAEETGLIIAIGEWVLNEACRRIKELQEEPRSPSSFKKISVNISSKQFKQPTFAADVKKIINNYDINPSFLELEVTEGALISDLDDAIEKMLVLKDIGIKFSIDDFGTGYSSLTYLKKLPVDIIKIDKSFITNMHNDNDDKILTQTIIQMSQNLKLGLIAEGVEKLEHLNFLQEKGCESYQGFLFSKPLPFEEFKDLLLLSKNEQLVLLQDTTKSQ